MYISVAIGLVAVLALGGAGYFYIQNTSSQNAITKINQELLQRKDEKSALETELVVLKSSDLGKEVEILQLKLQTAERDFAAKEKELIAVTQEKLGLASQLQTARANSVKIRARLDAIDAIDRMVGAGPNAGSVAAADSKISVIQETGITEAWAIAKRDIDFVKMSWNGNTIADAVIVITRSIRNLLP